MEPRHPDDLPYVHGRDLVPLRQHTRFTDHRRERLFAAEDQLRARIAHLDQVLVDTTIERRRLLDQLEHIHDQVRPSYIGARGRRRRALTHDEPLPPIAAKPHWLAGRALRAICLALLRNASRALTLRELHALLHRAGYAIASALPVKALADALGHETDVGRAERVARGTYTTPRTPPTPTHTNDNPTTLPDW